MALQRDPLWALQGVMQNFSNGIDLILNVKFHSLSNQTSYKDSTRGRKIILVLNTLADLQKSKHFQVSEYEINHFIS